MKKILLVPLLPITLLLICLKKVFELMIPLAEDIGNGIENILNDNYHFWKKIWLKIIKTILDSKNRLKS